MFKKSIGKTPASVRKSADMEKIKSANTKVEPNKSLYMVIGVLSIVVLILLVVLYSAFTENKKVTYQNHSIKAKMIELSKPKYDEVNDFLLNQCTDDGVYCVSTQTGKPSLEMMKFLVNFRENPGKQYRLIFELSVGGDQENKDVLKCDGKYANFYVCQEITSSSPTDVIRAFEGSYRSLSGEATYNFNLMVKPIGELDYAKPIGMKPMPQ